VGGRKAMDCVPVVGWNPTIGRRIRRRMRGGGSIVKAHVTMGRISIGGYCFHDVEDVFRFGRIRWCPD